MKNRLCMAALPGILLFTIGSHAETRRVPSPAYPTVSSAYVAAVDGDVIEVEAGLRLELPGLRLNDGKRITLQPVRGRAIIVPDEKPANDEATGSLPLQGISASTTAYNYTATRSPAEPAPRFALDPSTAGRTMWWSWTAPRDGLVVMAALSREISVTLDVYTGNPPVAVPQVELDSWLTNQLSFHVVSNAQYLIAISAEHEAYGEVTLTIGMPDPPPNDRFASPILLLGDSARATAYTYAASHERKAGEPNHAGAAAGASVWFRWTAPMEGVDPFAPVTLTTAGSDFDTLLAVYQGTSLANLTLVRSSDDTTNGITVDRFASVTFLPRPGAIYHIAVDGSTNRLFTGVRNVYGNLVLRLDYSPVNLSLAARGFVRAELPDQSVRFSGPLLADNHTTNTVGPLRVRVVAQPGFTRDEIQRAPLSTSSNLVILDPMPATLGVGRQASVSLLATSPPPVFDTNRGRWQTWGLSALLEERLGTDWLPVDSVFLGYGFLRPENDDGSLGTGPPRPPVLTTNVEQNVRVQFARIDGTNVLADQSAWDFLAIAVCSDGTNRWVTNATWTLPPGMSMSTEGILTIGSLERTTTNVVTARFQFNRGSYASSTNVVVYRRPRFNRLPESNPNLLALQLVGETGRRYVVERAETITATNWMPVMPTNTFGSQPILIREAVAPMGTRYYRARLIP